jgi:hypothetical protein
MAKKSKNKSRRLSRKSKNNNIKKFATNKFVILAFIAVVAVIGIFAIYQSNAATQYGPFTISTTDDTRTQGLVSQWNAECYGGFKNRATRGNGGPTPQTANTQYYNNDNNENVLGKYEDCWRKKQDAFYSVNKYNYQTMIKGGGADLKACRVSNDPNQAVKVRLFPNWERVDQIIAEEIPNWQARGIAVPADKTNWRFKVYGELYGGGASGTAFLIFDNPKTYVSEQFFRNVPVASKKLFYETDYYWESNVTIATGEFSGYFSQLNNNNPNPKARFHIGWVDKQQSNGWVNTPVPPDKVNNEYKEVRFLDIPKCS